jgi:hypothetical protein
VTNVWTMQSPVLRVWQAQRLLFLLIGSRNVPIAREIAGVRPGCSPFVEREQERTAERRSYKAPECILL